MVRKEMMGDEVPVPSAEESVMEKPKPIAEHSDMELKAMAFDMNVQKELIDENLKMIYQELNSRAKK